MCAKYEWDQTTIRRDVSTQGKVGKGRWNKREMVVVMLSDRLKASKSTSITLTTLYEPGPGRRGEHGHLRGKRQIRIGVLRTPNTGRPPQPLPPRDLYLGQATTLDGRGKEFLNELHLENVFSLFPTFGTFVCMNHLPAEIRVAPETHDFLNGVRPRGHQLNRRPIIPDVGSIIG